MIEIDNKKLASVVSSFQVPAKPQILTEIQSLMADDEPSIDKIAELISSDVGLSSAILKIINSPLYGVNRKISKIRHAVMALGLKAVGGLVVALVLKSTMRGESSISLESFWKDSSDLANAMSFIGSRIDVKVPQETLYSIGLFQNCGIPILAMKYSDYDEVLLEAGRAGTNSIELEEIKYKTNHAVLGYFVATSWHLPNEICRIILQHHDVEYLFEITGSTEQLAFAILKAAENLVERVKRNDVAPDWKYVEARVFDVLGISAMDYIELEDEYTSRH
ncbi:HDOD domain-containing protein [Cognaticolwellia mytili]|uniref:HDOD domain-containing protein n=1 Tax=Cognaticolwellia mytili TaxID=1888913 RepID=UPI000A1708E6|nr:HDOD domain-containing protein [Cognaticolwellia mytili]